MVWVSNRSNTTIIVAITINGGTQGNFTVEPFIAEGDSGILIQHESWEQNLWGRNTSETLTAIIGGTKLSFEVQPTDHVTFYLDTYEIFTSTATEFWMMEHQFQW